MITTTMVFRLVPCRFCLVPVFCLVPGLCLVPGQLTRQELRDTARQDSRYPCLFLHMNSGITHASLDF